MQFKVRVGHGACEEEVFVEANGDTEAREIAVEMKQAAADARGEDVEYRCLYVRKADQS